MEHLWAWPTVWHETFDAWHAFDSDVVAAALGDPLPERLTEKCRRLGIAPSQLYELLEHVVEIVYGSLFGRADDKGSLSHLQDIERLVAKQGVELPPADRFSRSRYDDRDGWGPLMKQEEVNQWRRAEW